MTGRNWASLVIGKPEHCKGQNHRALSNKRGYKVLCEQKCDNVWESKLKVLYNNED